MTDAPRTIDPLSLRPCATRWFEDYEVGEVFYIPSRTMTDALFPIHYDRHWCAAHGHRELLAHGYQVVIQTCAGAGQLPHVMGDALVAFLEQGSKFLGAVYAGDTLYPQLRISELTPGRSTGVMTCEATVWNQDGKTVLEGFHKYLLKKRPA